VLIAQWNRVACSMALAALASCCAAGAASAATPATFLICGGGPFPSLSAEIYATRDGAGLTRLTTGARPGLLTAARDRAIYSGFDPATWGNQMVELTAAPDGTFPSRRLKTSRDSEGWPVLSRDGSRLAYVDRRSDGHDGLLDVALVVRGDATGRPREITVVHAVGDMDFDAHNRLHVLTAIAGAGSRITVGDGRRTQMVLRRRTSILRYSAASGRLALGGFDPRWGPWSEVRTPTGQLVARRRQIVVLSWARDGRRVLVLRRTDGRLAYWSPGPNRLSLWPRLACGRIATAQQ